MHNDLAKEDIAEVLDVVFEAVKDIKDMNLLVIQGRDVFTASVKKQHIFLLYFVLFQVFSHSVKGFSRIYSIQINSFFFVNLPHCLIDLLGSMTISFFQISIRDADRFIHILRELGSLFFHIESQIFSDYFSGTLFSSGYGNSNNLPLISCKQVSGQQPRMCGVGAGRQENIIKMDPQFLFL